MKPKRAKNASCQHCPLNSWDNALVPSQKIENQDLIIVLDWPGQHEAFVKQPLTGSRLQFLRTVLDRWDVDIDRVYFTNALLCAPRYIKSDTSKLQEAINACRGRLTYVLSQFGDDVPVLALGNWAMKALGLEARDKFDKESLTGKPALGTRSIGEVLANPPLFYQWVRAIGKWAAGPVTDVVTMDTYVNLLPDFEDLDGAKKIAIDIETNTLDRNNPDGEILQIGIGWAVPGGTVQHILTHETLRHQAKMRTWFWKLFNRYGHKIGGHNFKFDILWLNKKYNVPLNFGWDTMLAANVVHEYWHKGLKDLATFYFDADDYESNLTNYLKHHFRLLKDRHYGHVPEEMLTDYLVLDIHYTLMLDETLDKELDDLDRWEMPYLDYELPLNRALCQVEVDGFRVDEDARAEAAEFFQGEMVVWRDKVSDLSCGLIENPNSPQQVARYLWTDQQIPFPRMPGYTKPSTAAAVLEEILDKHPVIPAIIKYRRVAKLYGSYIKNLDKFLHYGKVFPSYKQAHVKTGRLSAEDPPIQTIPRKDERKDGDGNYGQVIKSLFLPDPGQCLVSVDGSQWELRVATALSLDPYLLKIYNDGVDFHGAMCDLLYGPGWTSAMRADEKRIMFGLLYGGTLESLVSVANLTIEQKKRVMHVFNTKLTRLIEWRDEMFDLARTKGIFVAPHYNRAFHFDLVTKGNARDVKKFAVNWPVQGIASMITSEALYRAQPQLKKYNARILATVHDSIIVTCPLEYRDKVAAIVATELEQAGYRVFPQLPWVAEAEWGYNWGHLETLEVT